MLVERIILIKLGSIVSTDSAEVVLICISEVQSRRALDNTLTSLIDYVSASLGRGEPHDPVHCAFIKFNEGSDRFSVLLTKFLQSLKGYLF